MEASSVPGSSRSGAGPSGRTEVVRIAMFYQWKFSHYFVVADEREKNCAPAVHFARPVASRFPVPEIPPPILRNIWKVSIKL